MKIAIYAETLDTEGHCTCTTEINASRRQESTDEGDQSLVGLTTETSHKHVDDHLTCGLYEVVGFPQPHGTTLTQCCAVWLRKTNSLYITSDF